MPQGTDTKLVLQPSRGNQRFSLAPFPLVGSRFMVSWTAIRSAKKAMSSKRIHISPVRIARSRSYEISGLLRANSATEPNWLWFMRLRNFRAVSCWSCAAACPKVVPPSGICHSLSRFVPNGLIEDRRDVVASRGTAYADGGTFLAIHGSYDAQIHFMSYFLACWSYI